MERLFDVIVDSEGGAEGKTGARLGIRCAFVGETAVCPVSARCSSVAELEAAAEKVRNDLDRAVDRARTLLDGGTEERGNFLSGDMTAEELWRALEALPDEAGFAETFNGLEEERRRQVAEYVLTSCNVFTGRPALFSSRYDAETALLES